MKSKYTLEILMVATFLLSAGCADASKVKEPEPKVKNAYGILSAQDLEKDPHNSRLEWQCFLSENIKIEQRAWRGADPLGRFDHIVTMCDFEIIAGNEAGNNSYGNRRARQSVVCQDFKKDWNELLKNQRSICIQGFRVDDENGWVWEKIKTNTKQYCYFGGWNC
jgi:hypothetical protein